MYCKCIIIYLIIFTKIVFLITVSLKSQLIFSITKYSLCTKNVTVSTFDEVFYKMNKIIYVIKPHLNFNLKTLYTIHISSVDIIYSSKIVLIHNSNYTTMYNLMFSILLKNNSAKILKNYYELLAILNKQVYRSQKLFHINTSTKIKS